MKIGKSGANDLWQCQKCKLTQRNLKNHTCQDGLPRKHKPHTRRARNSGVLKTKST